MKGTKLFVILLISTMANLLIIEESISQSPQSFNYQAVVRDANGDLITNTAVGMQISILKDGSPVCVEEFTPTTNAFGLVTLAIGSINTTDFAAINWSTGTFSVKIELDPNGGTSYSDMGTSQLLSVPFALNAKTSENAFSGNYSDLSGKPDLSDVVREPSGVQTGDMIYYNGSAWTSIDKPTDSKFRYSLEWDFTNNKPYWKQVLPSVVFNGKTLYIHPSDNSTGIAWYNGSYVTTNATSTTDGEVNTVIIVTSQGVGDYAAKLCADLVAYGYDDWYLPAKDELNAIYLEKDLIEGFSPAYYWSSTEYNNTDAWGQDFSNGSQVSYAKYPTSRCRCVRK
ncbi:hypothetical protein ES705_08959 [subsurface metagenome]